MQNCVMSHEPFSQDINAVEHYQKNGRRGNPFQAEYDIGHSFVGNTPIV